MQVWREMTVSARITVVVLLVLLGAGVVSMASGEEDRVPTPKRECIEPTGPYPRPAHRICGPAVPIR